MDKFYDIIGQITNSINKKCSSKKSIDTLGNQLSSLIDSIELGCVPETEQRNCISVVEQEVYSFYKEYISPLINLYEVYCHNFPETVSDMIYEITLRLFDASDDTISTIKKRAIIQEVQKRSCVLYYAIGLEIIDYYIKQYNYYVKVLKKFNYKNVEKYGINKKIQQKLNQYNENIKPYCQLIKKHYNSFFDKKPNKNGSYKLNMDKIKLFYVERFDDKKKVESLDYVVLELKNNIKAVEQYCSDAVEYGYNPNIFVKILKGALYTIIPIATTVVAILTLTKVIII